MKFKTWDINLKVRLFGEALLDISFWTVFPFLTIYFSKELGIQITSFLLIGSQVLTVFTGLLGGYFADNIGRKKMMSISVIGECFGFLLFAFSATESFHQPYIGFLGFTIASVFTSFYQPASQAMIADVVAAEHRSHVYAVFYMMINVAVVIGPIIGSVVFYNYPVVTLVAIAFADLLLLVLLQKFGHETAPLVLQPEGKIKKTVWEALREQVSQYKIIFKDKVFLLFIVAGVIIAQAFMQLDLLFPLYIKDVIGTSSLFHFSLRSEQLFGVSVALNGFLVATFTVIVSRQISRFKEKFVFMNSSFLYGIALFIFGFSAGPWGVIIAIILFSFAELMTVGIQQNFISIIAPENLRGMYFSASSLRYTVGKVVAPFAITLASVIDYPFTFIIIGILAIFSGFVYYYMYFLFEKQR